MPTDKASASVYIALLRGINVGGKNSLPMKSLAAMLTEAGCSDVKTYIQSGNVVFRAASALAPRIPELVSNAIQKAHKLSVPVVVRSAAALKKIASSNPFLPAGAALDKVHVGFLAERPTAAAVASLDPQRSPGDEFRVLDSEIYLHCPNGVARTKLTTQYFDSRLQTVSTFRNWNTVLKLVEMTAASLL